MQVIALASIVLSAAAGASAMTLVHRDTLAARNDTPSIARSSSADFTAHATFYAQNGLPGACGVVHSDGDLVAAIRKSTHSFRVNINIIIATT